MGKFSNFGGIFQIEFSQVFASFRNIGKVITMVQFALNLNALAKLPKSAGSLHAPLPFKIVL